MSPSLWFKFAGCPQVSELPDQILNSSHSSYQSPMFSRCFDSIRLASHRFCTFIWFSSYRTKITLTGIKDVRARLHGEDNGRVLAEKVGCWAGPTYCKRTMPLIFWTQPDLQSNTPFNELLLFFLSPSMF